MSYMVLFQLLLNSFNFVWFGVKMLGKHVWQRGECLQHVSIFCGPVTRDFDGLPIKVLELEHWDGGSPGGCW